MIKKVTIWFLTVAGIILFVTLVFIGVTFRSLYNEKTLYLTSVINGMQQTTEDLAESVARSAESIIGASYTRDYLIGQDMANKAANQQTMNRVVGSTIAGSHNIKNILILDSKDAVHSFSTSNNPLAVRLDREYGIFTDASYREGFSDALVMPGENGENAVYYVYAEPIRNENSDRVIGTCMVICSCEALSAILSKIAPEVDGALFAILDADGRMLAYSATNVPDPDRTESFDEKRSMVLRQELTFPDGWSVMAAVPYSSLYYDMGYLRNYAGALIGIISLFLTFFLWQLRSRILVPIRKIALYFQNAPEYVLSNRLEIEGKDEIEIITNNINQTLSNIEKLNRRIADDQQRLYDIEIYRKKAQLEALRAQINPHFFYNTLNSIQGLAYEDRMGEICTVVASLSFIMRYSLH